jgi:hypothetical protein
MRYLWSLSESKRRARKLRENLELSALALKEKGEKRKRGGRMGGEGTVKWR